jgi:F-type H+-transporting ATPase subunit epsilon
MRFHFELITPEKIAYKEEVEELIIPTTNGQITILPQHTSLFTKVENGEMIIKKNNKEQFMAVTEGFLEVNNNNVTLLADYAIRSEEIEVSKALEAQKKAEKIIKDSKEKISREDFALAESQFRRSILELKVASKRRKINLPPGTKT